MANETILLEKVAKFWNQQDWQDRPDGYLIVTSQRLIFQAQHAAGSLSFPLAALENLRTIKIWLLIPALQFEYAHQIYVFTLLWNAEAVLRVIQQSLQEVHDGT
jgi:hypothetical protein